MQGPNYLPMHEKLYTHVHEYILVYNMDDARKKIYNMYKSRD